MTAELTPTAQGWRTWRFGCDVCDRFLWTTLDREPVAVSMARINGWVVDESTLCPACASVAAAPEPVSGQDPASETG